MVILVAIIVLHTPWVPPVWSLFVLLGVAFAVQRAMAERWPGTLSVVVIISGLTLLPASLWWSSLLPESCERRELQVRGRVHGLPQVVEGRSGEPALAMEFTLTDVSDIECAGPRRARITIYAREHAPPLAAIEAGDELVLRVRLRRPWGSVNPAALQGERRYFVAGIHAMGSASEILMHRKSEAVGMALVHRLRARFSRALREDRGTDAGALLSALAVGDRRFMSAGHWERLRRFGLTHLLVISGLHISLAAICGWFLGRVLMLPLMVVSAGSGLSQLRSLGGAGGALVCGVAYALMAGLTLPTQRALIMVTLALLPPLLGRRIDRGRILGFAILALWGVSPASVLGPSFALSVGAVVLLLWFSLWQGELSAWRQAINVQGFIILAMVPMSLFWFQSTSSAAALINLIAVPLVTWVLVPMLLAAGFLALFHVQLAQVVTGSAAGIIDYSWQLLANLETLGGEPRGAFAGISVAPALGSLLSLLCAALLLPLPKTKYRLLLIGLLASPVLFQLQGRVSEAGRITIFDVGQGTSVFVEARGKTMLYDTAGLTGSGQPRARHTVLPWLLSRNLRSLDLLVVSHEDSDHSGGEALLRDFTPPRILRRGHAPDSQDRCRAGEVLSLTPDFELRFLSLEFSGDTDNNTSCVVMVTLYGYRLLLPGDIDQRRERELVAYWGGELEADLLLAGHHGSGSSTGRLWLRTVAPRQVVVSAGRANTFGHPAARVVADVNAAGADLLSTAVSGALVFTVDNRGRVRCRRTRHRNGPFWRGGREPRDCTAVNYEVVAAPPTATNTTTNTTSNTTTNATP